MSELSTIMMNYSESLRQADKLDLAANIMEQQSVSGLNDIISNIHGLWKGENADHFLQKCVTLQENVKKTTEHVRKTASAIRKIAKNTYDAEMRNYELAKKREYS